MACIKLNSYICILLMTTSSIGFTEGIDNDKCEYIRNEISTARNIDGNLMKKYFESCDLSKIPTLAEDTIESMQRIIDENLKDRRDHN